MALPVAGQFHLVGVGGTGAVGVAQPAILEAGIMRGSKQQGIGDATGLVRCATGGERDSGEGVVVDKRDVLQRPGCIIARRQPGITGQQHRAVAWLRHRRRMQAGASAVCELLLYPTGRSRMSRGKQGEHQADTCCMTPSYGHAVLLQCHIIVGWPQRCGLACRIAGNCRRGSACPIGQGHRRSRPQHRGMVRCSRSATIRWPWAAIA
jgi:hypothetical protein